MKSNKILVWIIGFQFQHFGSLSELDQKESRCRYMQFFDRIKLNINKLVQFRSGEVSISVESKFNSTDKTIVLWHKNLQKNFTLTFNNRTNYLILANNKKIDMFKNNNETKFFLRAQYF